MAKTSPSKTRDQLIEEALEEAERIARSVLAKHPRRVDGSTVIAAAHIALVTAADTFDHRRGSWGGHWKARVSSRVRAAIKQELAATRAGRPRAVGVEAHDKPLKLPPDYMRGLSLREQSILRMRYEQGRTFGEIGILVRLSPAWVAAIHSGILWKLRERSNGGSL